MISLLTSSELSLNNGFVPRLGSVSFSPMIEKCSNSPDLLLTTKRFSVVRHSLVSKDGKQYFKETIEHPGAVVILAIDDESRVVMIKNHRVAVDATLWELPAGTLDRDEAPQLTAARELQEETGYTAKKFESIGKFWMSPGILRELMHCYVATGLQRGSSALEVGEEIETHLIPLEECLAMIDRGEIIDAKTIAVLLLWERKPCRRE
jgi:ADP-ribose pyrophosphatase